MALKHMFPWLDAKAAVCFCSTAVICVLLLAVLYFTPEGGRIIPGGGCGTLGPLSSNSPQQNIEQVEEERKSALYRDSFSNSLASTGSSQRDGDGGVEEWRRPAVTDDRPEERLEGRKAFGEPRRYLPLGSAAFLFVQFGAYRYGANVFAVVGLGAKSLHKFGNPGFECAWVSSADNFTVRGWINKKSPDWGLGRQYTSLVVHCSFSSAVGADGSGGRLEFVAHHGSSDRTGLPAVSWVALKEEPTDYNGSDFREGRKHEYLYCGSPIFGSISPQRMREWIAYHAWRFGPRSHFVLYDAGGIHEGVQRILEPWVEKGFVSVLNMRQESRYDDYYYSQFLANNDCLFKAKTSARWAFFFDVDEYVHVPDPFTFEQVMSEYNAMGRRAQQVLMKQNFMNNNHCRRNESLSSGELERQWGFEKLVYRRTQHTKQWGFLNKKYAIQAEYASSTGVHNSIDTSVPEGAGHSDTVVTEEWKMTYHHYHHTIDNHGELCEKFVDPAVNGTKLETQGEFGFHVLDLGMAVLADVVREFEIKTVGELPFLP